jgi:tetratricopeptide (TPR) repeat protein
MVASQFMDNQLTPFQQSILNVLESKRFWTLFVGASLLVMAISFGKYVVKEQAEKTEKLATEKLFEVESAEGEGLKANARLFSQEFVKLRMEWSQEKKDKMRKILSEIVAEFPKTNAAQSSRIRLASLDFLEGKYDSALKNFEEVIKFGNNLPSDVLTLTAQLGKGYTLESMNKKTEALSYFEELSKNEKTMIAAESILARVRILKALSRDKEIETLVKKLEADFPGTYYEQAARVYEAGLVR